MRRKGPWRERLPVQQGSEHAPPESSTRSAATCFGDVVGCSAATSGCGGCCLRRSAPACFMAVL